MNPQYELSITRLIDAPREKVFRAWTDPKIIPQWFAPKPWSVARADMDVRPGGATNVVMASPDGQEFPNPGQFLEVIPNEKLVFTDAYVGDWVPSGKPFFTAVLTFEDEGGKTLYTARALHWTQDDCDTHAKMGFVEGWGICAAQLEEAAKGL